MAIHTFDAHDRNSWYFGAMSRQDATELLVQERENGVFLVRDSNTITGDYVLCVKENTKVSHYIINKIQQHTPTLQTVYRIGDNSFNDLPELLDFYRIHYLDTTVLIRPALNEDGLNVQKVKDQNGNEHQVDMDDKRFRIKPYQQMLSSCTGALLTSILMTPLDVVKTRLQTQQKQMVSNQCFLYCNGLMDHLCPCPNGNGPLKSLKTQSTQYTGMIDAFYKISRHEGITALWSGLSPTLVLAIPATICYFVSYECVRLQMKDFYLKFNPAETEQPFAVPLLAGMAARTFSASVVSPLELIRTKMQSQKLSYYDVNRCLKSMIANEGVRGLWRGLGPTLFRDVPFSGIYWGVYEWMKAHYNVTVPTFWFSFAGGATAGSVAAIITAPFDVVKTHKQIEFGEKVLYAKEPVKTLPTVRTIRILQRIFHENGLRGIFAGVFPRVIKIAPVCAIMITSFEHGKAIFFRQNLKLYYEIHGNVS